jgi:hypothetical protein
MGNCMKPRQKIHLEVDEDSYEDALDEVLETIRTQIAIDRRRRLDVRIRGHSAR